MLYYNHREGVRPMKAKTKTIPIEQVVAMMYAVLSPYVEPTDSLAKILIQRVLAKYGYKLE
jgi:hypothetical protein